MLKPRCADSTVCSESKKSHSSAERYIPLSGLHKIRNLGALIAFVSVAITSPVQGQVNIEALRTEDSDSGLVGMVGVDLLLRTGNVDLVKLDVDARADHLTPRSSTLLLVNADLGFLSGDRFTNDGLLHLRHGRVVGRVATLEGFGQLNYDKARELDFRALLGGGIRFTLTDTQRSGLRVGIGCMFEHESLGLDPGAAHPQNTDVLRSSNYVVVRFTPGDRVVLASTAYAQPSIDEPADIRLLNKSGLAVAVTRSISVQIKFSLRYDSRPPDGVARLDTGLTNGVAIRF